eukprot:1159301-Pelagomonas_calceolata.AAC.4
MIVQDGLAHPRTLGAATRRQGGARGKLELGLARLGGEATKKIGMGEGMRGANWSWALHTWGGECVKDKFGGRRGAWGILELSLANLGGESFKNNGMGEGVHRAT